MVEFTVRLGYAIFAVADADVPRPRHPAAVARLGRSTSRPTTASCPAGYWWEVLFDALAIASLVVSVTLISDAVQGVLER